MLRHATNLSGATSAVHWICKPSRAETANASRLAASFCYLPEGEGLGASRPDSMNVGLIGAKPSIFVPRDLGPRDGLLCSAGVCLLAGLAVSAKVGLGSGTLWASGSRVLLDCEPDCSFPPPAARAPASRISSRDSAAGADFFSRTLDLCGFGVGDSEVTCSAGAGVFVARSGFFSRATMTSCACTFPTKITLQSTAQKSRFSMMPPDKRVTPFTSPHS